ncbi:hypothetical protein M9458_057951, partial [Cirrhinus mrigala]
MATPKKAPCSEVEGFLHNVSPLIKAGGSNSKYFTAVVQEATRNSRVVVFDAQRHNEFSCAEKD